jgi:hypothetical protein
MFGVVVVVAKESSRCPIILRAIEDTCNSWHWETGPKVSMVTQKLGGSEACESSVLWREQRQQQRERLGKRPLNDLYIGLRNAKAVAGAEIERNGQDEVQ